MNLLTCYGRAFLSIIAPYSSLFLLVISLLIANQVKAQSETHEETAIKNRKYLIDNLSFYYVENPNSEGSEAYKLDNASITEGKREGAFWKGGNHLIPRLVEELLCVDNLGKDELKGNFFIQYDAVEILKILNKPVQIWIYNDQKPLNEYALEKYAPCTDSMGHVLPCATTFRKDNKQSDLWAGFVHLGVNHTVMDFDAQNRVSVLYDSMQSIRSIFIHMLVHTQDHSDIDTHESHTCEAQRWFKLGKDDHFFVRAVPDMMLAYQEGMANAFGLGFHDYEQGPAIKWFEKNGYLLVETPVDSTDEDFKKKIRLFNQIRKVAGEGDSIPGMLRCRGYKIRDLPPKFIVHNEIIPALLLASISKDKLREALVKTHATLADPNTSFNPLATLFKHLCEGELPAGETVLTAFRLPVDAPKPYLLPLALADYFTAFKAENKEEFGEIFDDELPQPWIDLYWDTMMEKVRKAIPEPESEPEEKPTTEKPGYELIPEIYEANIKNYFALMKVLHLPV